MHDDETEAKEQAKLAALYFATLLEEGLSQDTAQRLTVAWILAQHRVERPPWDGGLDGFQP